MPDTRQIHDLPGPEIEAGIRIELEPLELVARKVLELQRTADDLAVELGIFRAETQASISFTCHP
jgi:hypothetical protein